MERRRLGLAALASMALAAPACSFTSLGSGTSDPAMTTEAESLLVGASVEAIASVVAAGTTRLVSRENQSFCTAPIEASGRVSANRTCAVVADSRAGRVDAATANPDGRMLLFYRDLSIIDVFSADLTHRERTVSLDFSAVPGIGTARVARGVAVGEQGHVFVALVDPPMLIELGEAGGTALGRFAVSAAGAAATPGVLPAEKLVALGSWSLGDRDRRRITDIDTFAADSTGRAWILCRATQTMNSLEALPSGTTTAAVLTSYRLPMSLSDPEAITALGTGRWLVLNRSTTSGPSLILLAPRE